MNITIKDNSAQVLSELQFKIQRGLDSIGETAIGYAKDDTPVDTSRLMNSIDYKVQGNAVYIGTNVEYAKYVEFNEKAYHATGGAHFLKNAAANHGEEYKNILETSLK